MAYTKKTPKDAAIAENFSVQIHGFRVPKNALYGTFQGYSKPVKYILPEYPSDAFQKLTLYVWDERALAWKKAYFKQYKKLFQFVYHILDTWRLYGCTTVRSVGHISFPDSSPTGKKTKITGLKAANTAHYKRADQSLLRRNKSGEMVYRWNTTSNIYTLHR